MSYPALLTLVRENTLEDTHTDYTDYTASTDTMARHDEIELVDANGCPCAIPTAQPIIDQDYIFNYADGSQGRSARPGRSEITLSCDSIESAVRRKLFRWMKERARVYLSPGFGRNSIFAWRPIPSETGTTFPSGDTYTDLLGNALTVTQSTEPLLWDYDEKIFRGAFSSGELPVFSTPYGAGYGALNNVTNLFDPSYPESTTEGAGSGNSGWDKGGTDSAQITFAHVSGGFGHTDCPDSLRVTTTDDVSSSRYLVIASAFDSGDGDYLGYSFTGAGLAVLTLWVKGRFNEDSYLYFGQVGGATDSQYFSSLDTSEWTPITLTVYSSNWSSGIPVVYLYLNSTDGNPADFELGPIFIGQAASGKLPIGAYWSHYDDGATGSTYVSKSSLQMPGCGSMTASVYIPDVCVGDYNNIYLATTSDFAFYIYQGSSTWYVFFNDGYARFGTWTGGPRLNKANALTFVWDNESRAIYANGELLVNYTSNLQTEVSDTSGTMYLGSATATRSCFPAQLLTMRIDERAFSATEIKYLHASLIETSAVETIIAARARVYNITAIPSTIRPTAGGDQWIGDLRLSQVDYQPNFVDLTGKERSVP